MGTYRYYTSVLYTSQSDLAIKVQSSTFDRIAMLQVRMARRLALEWQAYVVRTHSLRKVFASVKGFYYQVSPTSYQHYSHCPPSIPALMDGKHQGLRRAKANLPYTVIWRFVQLKWV